VGRYAIDFKGNGTFWHALKQPLTRLLSLGSQVRILPGAPILPIIPTSGWAILTCDGYESTRNVDE